LPYFVDSTTPSLLPAFLSRYLPNGTLDFKGTFNNLLQYKKDEPEAWPSVYKDTTLLLVRMKTLLADKQAAMTSKKRSSQEPPGAGVLSELIKVIHEASSELSSLLLIPSHALKCTFDFLVSIR
jgi:hypothetical protein